MNTDTKLTYYLYSRFPGIWQKWTLAVLAIGRKDANDYVRATHRGGTYIGKVESGDVRADCGATTLAAQEVLRRKNECLLEG